MFILFSFLETGKEYIATVYSDAEDAHYKTNPQAYVIDKYVVDGGFQLRRGKSTPNH